MSYTVRLKIFEGPLDLLLYLIKKNEIDIYDIPIAEITDQYLEYIELMRSLNLDVAGEFLVMTSTLIYIKSRMLLPPSEGMEEEETVDDPRKELVERLLEYKKFKEAARWLSNRPILGRDTFARSSLIVDIEREKEEVELEGSSAFLLLEAFREVLKRASREDPLEIRVDRLSVMERIEELLKILAERGPTDFLSLFPERYDRSLVVVTFLAMLELIRLRMITVYQVEPFGRIIIRGGSNGEE